MITKWGPITCLTWSRAAAPAGIHENERRPFVMAMFSVRRLGERPVKMHIPAVHIQVLAGDMTSLA